MLFDVNLALLETGQLGDRMFEFPQDPQFLIQVGGEAVPHRGCHELLLQLGCINEAEQTAFEALEVGGLRPYLLRELALIHVVKGHPQAARVFLNLLSSDVIHGRWARERLVQLDSDPSFASDEEVCAMRKAMMRTDQVALPNQKLFAALVEDNPGNHAAMEYLMAYYLQTCQLEEVVKLIPGLRAAGFERLPESYAAAILLYHNLFGKEPEMAGWTVSQAEYERFQTIMKLTGGAHVDPAGGLGRRGRYLLRLLPHRDIQVCMKRRIFSGLALVLLAVSLVVYWLRTAGGETVPAQVAPLDRTVRLSPDYTDCCLPPNLAPLSFVVEEPGKEFRVHVHGPAADGFWITVAHAGNPLARSSLAFAVGRDSRSGTVDGPVCNGTG